MAIVKFVEPGQRRRDAEKRSDAKERKLFMSSRASDVIRTVESKQESSEKAENNFNELFFENFDSIFRRVEQLGNSKLPWKERKRLEQQKLEATAGAKPLKRPRRAPVLGLKTKRKKEEKERMKRDEDLAAGNYVKRIKKKRKPVDQGLRASQGIFKNGVLHVKPLGQEHVKGKKRRTKK